MNQRRKHLNHLLQTSHRFLEQPDNEQKWRDFQQALQVVEDIEKFEALAAQPENLKSPDEETRQLLRRYYENEVRPTKRGFRPQLWSSLAAAVFVLIGCYLVFNLTPLPMMLAAIFSNQTDTATATSTVTASRTLTPFKTATIRPSPTPRPTSTATPSSTATVTDTATITPSLTVTPSKTPRPSRTPKATATDTPRPTRTATPVPQLTSQVLEGSLTDDSLFRKYVFQGSAGDMLTIRLDSDEFDPFVGLYDEGGSEIMTNDDCGSLQRACMGPIQLARDGVYTVTVDSFSRRESGAYRLDIAVTQADCTVEAPRVLIVSDGEPINLRGEPNETSAIVGMIYSGECFAVIGRSANGTWLKIRTSVYRSGWILAALVQLQGEMETIPILTE